MNREFMTQQSILRMAQGAFERLVDVEMDRVIRNIMDPSTKAEATRKITVTIALKPSGDRQDTQVEVGAKTALAPVIPAATTLCVASDENGEMMVLEKVPQIPGQMDFGGDQQQQPNVIRMVHSMG